ncbi:kinase-like protein [Suillus ampliporus]|nr:kinase-like protein [Suillus ampliporus]
MLRHRSHVTPLTLSSGTRPRRSASLSDASGEDRLSPRLLPSQNQHQYAPRPGSSLGLNSARIRRVTSEQDEYAAEYAHRATEEALEPFPQPRQSPSPTHMSHAHVRAQTHHRRDSDTLRSLALNNPPTASSPTAVEHNPGRLSPSARNVSSSQLQGQGQAYHRRNPTAPEPPTTSGSLAPPPGPGKSKNGKTWAAGDEPADSESEAKTASRVRQAPPPPAPTPAPTPVRNHNIIVNKKVYARLDLIGKGGSSRVYRVMNANNEIYAVKRVSLDKTDAETMSGYMNEIGLLKRLEGNNRIIQLFDSEVKAGPGGTKGHLMLVMECGEVDLAKLLQEQQKEPMNMVWISYYWQQMLQAVHVIHEEKIVHSDLKPANFVLVRGQLKLIDFGIANAIANDTTNIQRDHQIGTVNYMSPEAIELPDGMRRLKVGRASDVWSLGCILYQMVYGHPPFQHLSVYQKMKAIPDSKHAIGYPGYSIPTVVDKAGERKQLEHLKRPVRADVIKGMESCLERNSKERATIPDLLEQEWLAMKESEVPGGKPRLAQDETIINPYYMKQLLEYGIKLGQQAQNGEIDQEYLAKEAERLVAELKALES